MGTLSPPPPGRRTVTFAVRGLAPRDEVLFKSFVRLLAHRTEQAWKPAEDGAPASVVVAGQQTAGHVPAAGPVLVVGPARRSEPHFVRFPLHADELEAALNAIGRTLAPAGQGGLGDACFRLLRWPPPTLLTNAARIRLATLLSVGSVPASLLPARCGCGASTCTHFLAELARAGLLSTRDVAVQPQAAARRIEAGLLDRIRLRLGRVVPARR